MHVTKRFLLVLIVLVFGFVGMIQADHTQDYIKYSGAGLDYTSWNGALLVGPGHTLWGVRIGYLRDGRLVTAEQIESDVTRAGPYSADRSFAELDLTRYRIKWAKVDQSILMTQVVVNEDITIVAEVYPAHQHKGHQEIPSPINNPAEITVAQDGRITGTSRYIQTVAGHTRITGGHAIFTNRSVQIVSADKGLDYFCMKSWPNPSDTLNATQCKEKGYSQGNIQNACMVFDAKKGDTICFAAAVGSSEIKPFDLSRNEIETAIKTAEKKYLNCRFYGEGQFGLCAEPMISEILWNSTYNPFEKKVFIPAGRPWMYDGRYNLWGWDENLCAVVVSLVSKEIADINVVLANADNRLGPYACWYVYSKYGQRDLLEKCYPVYKELYPPTNDELFKAVEPHKINVGMGMDDSPMREHWRKLGDMYSLDMTCIKAWNLEILAKIARVLGKEAEAQHYQKSYESLAVKINETFWNEKAGIYRNRYVSGQWPVTESPTSFYPWLAGVVDAEKSDRLLSSLLDETKFWGQYVIVSLAMDDPQYGKQATEKYHGEYFPPYCYWRGNIWPPTNYLVYEGLKRARYDQVASEYASKTVKMWHDNWLVTGGFPENFNPETGKRSKMAHKHQTWSTLFTMIGVKELIDVEVWSNPDAIRFGTFVKGDNTIYNYYHRGNYYDLEITDDGMILKRDKQLLVKTASSQCVIRDYLCVDGKVSCTVNSKQKQKIEFYLSKEQGPVSVSVPAGTCKVSL